MSEKQISLGNFFERGGMPNDETVEDSKTVNKKNAAFKRKYQKSYRLKLIMSSLQQMIRWFTFSKTALFWYNMSWPAIQWSHETFKTTFPHGNQAPALKDKPLTVCNSQDLEAT